MTVYDRELLNAIKDICRELRQIKKILQAEKASAQIAISKDGMIVKGRGVMPDLESFIERMEDDHK